MAEVQALALHRAPLVVLSACDTFRGELRSGGVVGITRAFVAAGARTLVASLWKLDDKATRELMKRFYGQLIHADDENVRGNVVVAVQKTMVSMIGAGFSVHQWAGFVVYGLDKMC